MWNFSHDYFCEFSQYYHSLFCVIYIRIQQIQLLGRDLRGSDHDNLWNQIEAEIHLHRHKTVIRACRGRRDPFKKTPAPPVADETEEENNAETRSRRRRGIGDTRTVVFNKDKREGLGISITVSRGAKNIISARISGSDSEIISLSGIFLISGYFFQGVLNLC